MTVDIADKLLLTVNDLCRLLSISRSQFFCQRSLGRIPLQPIRIGSKLLFCKAEVEAWTLAGCPAHNWERQNILGEKK
jgi:predicted DNA-binding transcriptional regulator AlpA